MELRPAARRGEARRAEILGIAREVFLEQGYAAASMSAIAARVGGSKGTLYNHFRSKEALFTAFLTEACAVEAAHAFDFSDFDGDVGAGLHRLGVRFLRFVLSDTVAAVHRVVIAEGARFPELGRAFYDIGPREGIARFSAFLSAQAAAGLLQVVDAPRAAEQFLELCKAGLHQRRLWGLTEVTSDEEIEANVDAAVYVFMAAYGPGAAR